MLLRQPRAGLVNASKFAIFNALSMQMANTHLVMGTIPELGRSHFFALQSMVSSVVFGISPIVRGILIDVASALATVVEAERVEMSQRTLILALFVPFENNLPGRMGKFLQNARPIGRKSRANP